MTVAPFSLEQYIIRQYYYPNTALKELFYQFWSGFDYSGTTKWIREKVNLAKTRTANAKTHEANDMPATAETEIKKVIPLL